MQYNIIINTVDPSRDGIYMYSSAAEYRPMAVCLSDHQINNE